MDVGLVNGVIFFCFIGLRIRDNCGGAVSDQEAVDQEWLMIGVSPWD